MNVSAFRTAARQLGLWGSLLLMVALLTTLFNILGTITTAVVAGVIMGASRRWSWRTLPVSAVFALAGLIMAQVAKADLQLHQRFWMTGVSVGAFWVTYLLTLLLMCLEKDQSAGVRTCAPGTSALPLRSEAALESLVVAETVPRLSLRDFQGCWRCETNRQDGQADKRIMEIAEHKFALRIRDAGGRVRLVAEGEWRLEETPAGTRLSIQNRPTEQS